MSRCIRLLCLAGMYACFLSLARGDSRSVYRTTVDGREWTAVMYRRGSDFRTETGTDSSASRNIRIFSAARRTMLQLDETSQQYSESTGPDAMARLAAWIARPPRIRESGKTMRVYYETVDTGERRSAFGFTARHLILRERHAAEPGGCSISYTVERDGWYEPVQPALGGSYRLEILSTGAGGCRDAVVEAGARFHPGLTLEEIETTEYAGNPRRVGPSVVKRKLLDFSTAPLSAALFEVPPGFTRQDAADWRDRLAMDWAQLENAFDSWFD